MAELLKRCTLTEGSHEGRFALLQRRVLPWHRGSNRLAPRPRSQMLDQVRGIQQGRSPSGQQAIAACRTAASGIGGDDPKWNPLRPSQLRGVECCALLRAFDQDQGLHQAHLQALSQAEMGSP